MILIRTHELFKKLFIYFNWRQITLKYYGGFCHILTRISHRYTCVPPSWTLPPTCLPTPSLQVITEHPFWVPCIIHRTRTGYLFYIVVGVLIAQSCLTPCDHMDCSHQAPLSMEFFRQGNGSELPFPSPRDLPNPGTEPRSLVSPALAGGFFTTVPPGKPLYSMGCNVTFMLTMREIRQRKVQ